MKRTVRIKIHNDAKDVKITNVTTLELDNNLSRDEVQRVVDYTTDELVQKLRDLPYISTIPLRNVSIK